MTDKHQVHNLIVLDESGSMVSIKEATIRGFNEIVQTIKGVEKQFPEQAHYISFISFNGLAVKTHLWKEPVSQLQTLDDTSYEPDASTPLFDALGQGLTKLKIDLKEVDKYNVLVTVFTDGEENASVEYNLQAIKALIEDLRQKRWTFTYIGTDHDVDKMATSISINNVMVFEKSEEAINKVFKTESAARMNYALKISRDEETDSEFY